MFLTNLISAQTSDATEGCAPLTVNFSAPNASSYFWDFNDGASSIEQNPDNIFTTPGTYRVQLFTAQGGSLVGEIEVNVYPQIEVEITNENDWGCIPFPVGFTSSIDSDPAIIIENIEWTFGDGSTGTGATPMTTYNITGLFDISVEVKTNLIQCNKTVIFEDIIETEDLTTELIIPEEIPCTEPTTITIESGLVQDSRYTYEWRFGNGQSSNEFEPPAVTYDSFGTYEVSLTVSSPSGCVKVSTAEITTGPVIADLDYPSMVCVGEQFTIVNRTLANRHDWRYGDPLMRSSDRDLTLRLDEVGTQEILLISSSEGGCERRTNIEIEVEEVNASFSFDPAFRCDETQSIILTADDPNLSEYSWNGIPGGPTVEIAGLEDPRDPLHINQERTTRFNLQVTSDSGCKADTTIEVSTQLPEAYFIPDKIIGFNSLTVNFTDFSDSATDIVRRFWDYGDGTTAELDPDILQHSHTYECGVYFVSLFIEDANGCVDKSREIEITVLCTIEVPIIETDIDPICVNDVLNFESVSVLDLHLYTDDDRFYHCWKDRFFSYQFLFPGVFESELLAEYEGEFYIQNDWHDIIVLGARAEITYDVECGSRTYQFQSISNNAETYEWRYDGNIISTVETFTHTFDQPGEHDVTLTVSSELGNCAPDIDTVTVFVPELKADFEFPEQIICDSEFNILDASSSTDVYAACNKGYKWIFEDQRPRVTENPILEHKFLRGDQEVTLVVEDINGCTDTLTKTIRVFGVEADYNLDSIVCLNYDKDFIDQSISDTTLVQWEWSFGSDEQNPTYIFDESDLDTIRDDTITVLFVATDILGCTDTLINHITVVDNNFIIQALDGTRLCEGEEGGFAVIDTTGSQDDYNFYWDVDGIRQDTGLQVSLVLNEPGIHTVTLIADHKLGACTRSVEREITVLEAPMASFTTDVDDLNIICHPAQITFTSDPAFPPNEYDFEWRFGEEDISVIRNPTIEFGRGTHEVTQIITNSLGCKDSISQFITLVGPEGSFNQDKELICIGEEITFTLMDTFSISHFTWNFGDGTELEDTNPVSHQYAFNPPGDSTIVTLTLFSDDTGCDLTVESPVRFSALAADIMNLGQLCNGEIQLENNSVGATNYDWNFGDGTSSDEANPIKVFEEEGSYQIILTVNDGTCEAQDSITVVVDEDEGIGVKLPNLFTPNGNGANDFFGPVIINGTGQEEVIITTFKIYNRYGELVYDNTNPQGWNGNFNAEGAPPEVYAYYIEIDISGCERITRKGGVTLMR